MLRRRKKGVPQDTRRSELLSIVRSAEGIPRPMLTVALLAVSKMPIDQVEELLALSKELIPLAESGDKAGIEGLLKEKGISDELIGTAMAYYDDLVPGIKTNPRKNGD